MTYKFSLGLTSFCLALIAAFISLGYWQVHRAEEKSALQQAYESAGAKPVAEINAQSGKLSELLYHRVRLVGHLEADNQILLDNQTHKTTAGYHVLTPIRLSNSDRRVMINRGWVAGTSVRTQLPVFDTPTNEVVITGTVVPLPSRSPLIGDDVKPDIENEKAWFYFDSKYYQEKKNIAVGEFWVQQEPDTDYGFVRIWGVYDAKVMMHVGYAIMWFSFAVIMLAIYLSMSISRKTLDAKKQDPEDSSKDIS
ncbi:MAG: SURF1 family protein [Pseudomonadales bacterium]|nr:SURF1 family protein [Pseudomonadales bacterium]